ncbi:MAG: stage II sporulation protein M [Thermoplasmatales archaeon]
MSNGPSYPFSLVNEKNTFFFHKGILMLRRLFLVTFIVEMALFAVLSSINFHSQILEQSITTERSSIVSGNIFSMILAIFPHNLLIATIEFVPIVGPLLFSVSTAVTSLTVATEAFYSHINGFFIFLSLAALPHTWLELPSYAIAVSASIYLIYLLSRRELLRPKWYKVPYMYLFVIIELAVAATFESAEIILESRGLVVLLTWIAAVPVIYFLILLFRKINEDEYWK